MPAERPPTIAPAAAARWQRAAPARSPWLHEEVARRMEERLQWIRRAPAAWADWEPVRGGLAGHAAVARHYPGARTFVIEPQPHRAAAARSALARAWWRRLVPALAGAPGTSGKRPWPFAGARGGGGWGPEFITPPPGTVQMLWANMLLHMAADPQALLAQWHQALAVDGFLMFSCLGPDTLRELRLLYGQLGWPPPAHEFTDMHDWGDMLVQGGFAEPVMDMERITLGFATPQRLLQELRELGANLHPARFPALRGRGWRARLEQALERLRGTDGQLALTFEIIYGHALKPVPRARLSESSSVPLDDMRAMLRADKRPRG